MQATNNLEVYKLNFMRSAIISFNYFRKFFFLQAIQAHSWVKVSNIIFLLMVIIYYFSIF